MAGLNWMQFAGSRTWLGRDSDGVTYAQIKPLPGQINRIHLVVMKNGHWVWEPYHTVEKAKQIADYRFQSNMLAPDLEEDFQRSMKKATSANLAELEALCQRHPDRRGELCENLANATQISLNILAAKGIIPTMTWDELAAITRDR